MTDVTWWLGRSNDLALFEKNIASRIDGLRVEFLGKDSEERTIAALRDGSAGDIVMIPRAGRFQQLAREGYFADLMGRPWVSRVLALALSMGTVDGRLYGIPRSSETMLLLYDTVLFAEHGWRPPRTFTELETLARAMRERGIVPFGAGCADVPQSVELYFSLIVNHAAGPAYVKRGLTGELPWSSDVFVNAVETLRSWFDRGYFGDAFFTDTVEAGFARSMDGRAGMSPNMTWIFGELPEILGDRAGDVGVAPFPTAGGGELWVYGTGALVAVNASSPNVEAAAEALEKTFTNNVRRDFSRDLPGDWNLPLNDVDAHGLGAVTTPQFAAVSTALTRAVLDGRFGYSTWSFFPPLTEQAVIDNFRDMIEGRQSVKDYLAALDDAFHRDARPPE